MAIKMRRLLPYLLVLLLSLPTVISLMRPGYFPMHDDLQAIRVEGMTDCLKELQLPCRWVRAMGYGFGYPQFHYYGPLPYYLMSFFNLFGVGVFDSVKIGFALSLVLGNLAMFALARLLFKNDFSALLSTVLYAFAPFRASDLYSRGAMGESWAFIFMPLILFWIYRLANKPSFKSFSFLAVSFSLLMVTHNITTLIFTPFAILWGVLLFVQYGHRFSASLKWLSSSVICGAALSAFFVLPVIFEKRFAHIESMIGGYFDYRAHFITLKQMFFTSFWGYGSSEIGPTDDLSFFFSPLLLLLLLTSLIFLASELTRSLRLRLATTDTICILALIIFGITTAFMAHEKSSVIWAAVPALKYLQFPWRFLVLSNFFFSLSVGSILVKISSLPSAIILSVIILFVFLFSASYFRPVRWLALSEGDKFSGNLFDKQMTISIFDYLPTSASTPPSSPSSSLPLSSVRESSITNYVSSAAS